LGGGGSSDVSDNITVEIFVYYQVTNKFDDVIGLTTIIFFDVGITDEGDMDSELHGSVDS
jgi:hypothetical protein